MKALIEFWGQLLEKNCEISPIKKQRPLPPGGFVGGAALRLGTGSPIAILVPSFQGPVSK